MNEEFITFEQARALKECGFDWPCECIYSADLPDHEPFNIKDDATRYFQLTGKTLFTRKKYLAPTQALAQKWLRDVKGIDIDIRTQFIGRRQYDYVIIYKQTQYFANKSFTTYEEALASGLHKALELIKQK